MLNVKRFIFAGIAVFITYEALNFIIHSLILSSTYQAIPEVWRPDMMSIMWVMNIVSFVFAFLFVYLYSKKQDHTIANGIKLGFMVGLFMLVFPSFNQYVVYPIPFSLAIIWGLLGLVQLMICGVVASLIYKPKS